MTDGSRLEALKNLEMSDAELTMDEALLLASNVIARWGNDIDDDCDDCYATKAAKCVFGIYDRVNDVIAHRMTTQ